MPADFELTDAKSCLIVYGLCYASGIVSRSTHLSPGYGVCTDNLLPPSWKLEVKAQALLGCTSE